MTGKASNWAVLNNRAFRALWIASLVSGIGTTMHDTAAVWTLTTSGASPTLITLMQTMASLPLFLFALPAGALADIFDKRMTVVVSLIGQLIVAMTVSALALAGRADATVLLATAFLLGLGVSVSGPAWQALMAEVTTREEMSAAVSLGSVGVNVARAIGPAVGGLLVAAAGPGWVFAANGLTFVGLIAVLLRLRVKPRPVAQPEGFVSAVSAALRYAGHSAPMQAVLARNLAYVFCAVMISSLLPILAKARGMDGAAFGWLLGTYGLGGVTNALFILPRLRQRCSPDQLLAASGVSALVAALVLALVPLKVALFGALFVAGSAWIAAVSTLNIAAQAAFPSWLRARASALYLIAMQGALAVGAFVAGQVVEHVGLNPALLIAASGMGLGLLLVWPFPLQQVSGLNLDPSHHWPEHHLTVTPQPCDGPVRVVIEYRVAPENRTTFTCRMAEVREIRLRDGAYRWSLSQDLNEPELFRETMVIHSWAEHLRQHERATKSDELIEVSVESLHIGPGAPKVSHQLVLPVQA
jgi:MFS family permease